MCQLETEGVKYGCGHYQSKRTLRKIDCGSPWCMNSDRHPPEHDTRNCPCERYFGPDAKEVISFTTRDYCPPCAHAWGGRA